MKHLFLFGWIIFETIQLWAQDSISTNAQKFSLKNGIYLNQESFLNNSPDLPFTKVFDEHRSTISKTNFDLRNSTYYQDSLGILVSIKPETVFGYNLEGTFYKKVIFQDEIYFGRSVNPGSLWQFAAVVTSYNTIVDPSNMYNYGNYATASKNLLQVVYYAKANQVLVLDARSILPIIRQDPQTEALLSGVSKRKQRKRIYYYLRKFNQYNPLVFPNR